MLCQTSLHESCRMGKRIVVIKLICSLGHCECDGHTVHKLGQRRLTADWLAQKDSDFIDAQWGLFCLPSYIKATIPVLEIFNMDKYYPDSPRISRICYCCRRHKFVFKHCCEHSIFLYSWQRHERGTRWRSWLRHCATSRTVAGSIPETQFFIDITFPPTLWPWGRPSL
jgi:hypothetical protein